MSSLLRRTASVLLTTVIVALVVYSAVQLGTRAFADPVEVASGAGAGSQATAAQTTTSTTRATTASTAGATATSTQAAHATTTTTLNSTTTGQTESATLVCPRTGCTASSCHATDPSAPGGRK